ncbi:MAG: hypothetical protein ACM3XM_08860, partial [Mycobacterium leprae]
MLYLTSQEEERAIGLIRQVAGAALVPRQVFTWSATRGLFGPAAVPDTRAPDRALEFIEHYTEPAVFVLLDFHGCWRGTGRSGDAPVVRIAREVAETLRNDPVPRSVLFLAPVVQLPPEVEAEVVHLDLPLPSTQEIQERFEAVLSTNVENGWLQIGPTATQVDRLVRAALGLTLVQAEQALLRTLVEDPRLAAGERILLGEKRQLLRRSEILEWVGTDLTMADVGGLANLKGWLNRRSKAWDDRARQYQLPAPR